MLGKLRKLLRKTMGLPFHPQWFTRKESRLLQMLRDTNDNSIVLDIGCADKWVKSLLPANALYLGLDYPTTSEQLYKTRPDVFANAERLPFSNNSIDKICLLDVLEHIRNPLMALNEAGRVLKSGGEIILRVPFLYPIHDAPIDYTRFTEFGLRYMAAQCHLDVADFVPIGSSLETAALLRNLAYAKAVLDLIGQRNPLCLFGAILPAYFLLNNTISFLLAKLLPTTTIMPHTYLIKLAKA